MKTGTPVQVREEYRSMLRALLPGPEFPEPRLLEFHLWNIGRVSQIKGDRVRVKFARDNKQRFWFNREELEIAIP